MRSSLGGDPGEVVAVNCIIWDTDNGIWNNNDSIISITYSNVRGGWLGAGNINSNPLFVRDPDDGGDRWGDGPVTKDVDEGANDDYGNLNLQINSPCIDAGNNTEVLPEMADLDGNGNVTERTPLDLDAQLRFVEMGSPGGPGVAEPPDYPQIVDMGAYEASLTVQPDFDGDGDVDKDDLRAFDVCANPCIVGNVNCDEAGVNVLDLQFVKNNIFCTAETDPNCIVSDVNRDGNVNVLDLQAVKNVIFCSDFAVAVDPGCEWADFDDDGDVDGGDYRVMLECLSGPHVPVGPNCVDQ